MKKVPWLFLVLSLCLVVVGCNKRSVETVESVGIELESGESSSGNASAETNLEVVDDNVIKNDESNVFIDTIGDDKLSQITSIVTNDEIANNENLIETNPDNIMRLQRKIMDLQFPYHFVSYSELQNFRIIKHNAYEKSKGINTVIIPINVSNLDETSCQFEFNVIGLSGNKYIYNVWLEKPFIHTDVSSRDEYSITKLELILPTTNSNIIINDDYNVEFFNYEDGADDLLKLFEEHENLFYNVDKQEYIAIECKKISLIKKDRDEYLVVFARNSRNNSRNESLSHLACYYFENDVLKRKSIYENTSGNLSTFMYNYNNREDVYGFCGGIINDFNRNSIPEIYLHVSRESGMARGDEIYVLEWNGEKFVVSYLHIGNHSFENYEIKFSNEENKVIVHSEELISIDTTEPGVPANPSRPIFYEYKYSWNQQDGIYILTDMNFIDLPEYLF